MIVSSPMTTARAPQREAPPLRAPSQWRARAPGLFTAAVFLWTAICVNLSWIQELHGSDTFLLALISLDRYQPFYWGGDRYGMPVPLGASFIHDYQLNLLFQSQILIIAAAALV